MRRIILAAASLNIVLAGCAPLLAAPGRTTVEVRDSDFDASIEFRGPEVDEEGLMRHFLRSWVRKDTGALSHQLYVTHSYGGRGWIFWERADGEGARPLETIVIARDVAGCSVYGCGHSETIGIALPDSLLGAHEATGYSIRLKARTGREAVLTLTPDQIATQLAAIGEHRAGQAGR